MLRSSWGPGVLGPGAAPAKLGPGIAAGVRSWGAPGEGSWVLGLLGGTRSWVLGLGPGVLGSSWAGSWGTSGELLGGAASWGAPGEELGPQEGSWVLGSSWGGVLGRSPGSSGRLNGTNVAETAPRWLPDIQRPQTPTDSSRIPKDPSKRRPEQNAPTYLLKHPGMQSLGFSGRAQQQLRQIG